MFSKNFYITRHLYFQSVETSESSPEDQNFSPEPYTNPSSNSPIGPMHQARNNINLFNILKWIRINCSSY